MRMALKKSSKLKAQKSRKAWEMVRADIDYKTIGIEVGYTATAIKLFARKKYKDESEKLWAAEIKAIGHCEICLKDYELNAHHLLEKSIWTSLARDLSNGICLCEDHHLFNVQISAHACTTATAEFLNWLEEWRNGQFVWYEEHKTDRKYIGCDWELAYNELK
jgi:hypothetical protein